MRTFDSKPFFQRLLRPLAATLARRGVTANQVTAAAMVVSAVAGAIVAAVPDLRTALLAVPVALGVRLVCNHIDGLIAREHGSQSRLGAILNEQNDVFCDAVLYLPLAGVPGVPGALVVVAVLLGVVAEMTGVLATTIGADRRTDGPMSKKPRGLVVAGLCLALAAGAEPGAWTAAVFAAMIALLVVTVLRRTYAAVREATS